MANKSRSKAREAYASLYKTSKREESNRLRKLQKLLKQNPNNAAQLEMAIKNIRHRRKTPTTPMWTASKRKDAILRKEFKLSDFAYEQPAPKISEKTMFSLKTRAHDSRGNLVWN